MGYFRSINRKKRKKRRIFLFIFGIILLILLILFSKNKIKINNDYITKIALGYIFLDVEKPSVKKNNTGVNDNQKMDNKDNKPLVYIYNTHDSEKYSYNRINEYNLDYDVTFASQILKSNLDDNGIYSIVETSSVSNMLKSNNYAYGKSYEMSRFLL